MRIIHVEDYFDPTAGYQVNELLSAKKSSDDEYILITSNDMTPFHKVVDAKKDEEFEKAYNVKIIRLDKVFKISSRIVMKNLLKTIDKLNPDVVFFHGIGDFKDLLLLMKKRKYLIIRDCHMSWAGSHNKFRNLFFLLYRNTFARIINKTNKYSIVFSLGVEETEYLNALGINDNKIKSLPHGYNSANMYFSQRERDKLRFENGVKSQDILVGYIGKFNEYKRPDLIMDIIEKVPQDYMIKHNIKIIFVGPKEKQYYEMFKEKLSKFKYKNQVIIYDAVKYTELYKYFSATDVLIFPKETTLSSIHAQVCLNAVIMENHKSNIERVINNDTLYEINNLDHAFNILIEVIEKLNSGKINNEASKLLIEKREYSNQLIFINEV
ncbi:glycosyltransferase, partial [Macrococcus epidermidis]|uniref:glycosyltransferase n=1 Tax=Macrococcus epidermidis TaxID=1902580 RepID=UPI001EF1F1CB